MTRPTASAAGRRGSRRGGGEGEEKELQWHLYLKSRDGTWEKLMSPKNEKTPVYSSNSPAGPFITGGPPKQSYYQRFKRTHFHRFARVHCECFLGEDHDDGD